MLRRLFAVLGLVAGALAGLLAYRSRLGGGSTRVDVHFDDGSLMTFSPRSAEAQRLLPYARDAIAATRAS
jgi:hypothetical protein